MSDPTKPYRPKAMRFQVNKAVYVDVDGTLLTGSTVNPLVVEMVRNYKADGFEIVIWSARGAVYARAAAEKAEIANIADAILTKPGLILDDQGWTWTQYSKAILPPCQPLKA
jgi:hydroxymethylpyrimidine pyrophosphatase-like HAD family hydrolase